ncbi:MAG: DUF4177 domain-containing protein [Acholeplasmatales bacterium]|nr:DUF4177 domain-containing protein [Acholeplasmatales bacterium]
MYVYRVVKYDMKTGIVLGGTNFEKQNTILENYLNEQDNAGWELLSITSLPTDGKKFEYELVFRREKDK